MARVLIVDDDANIRKIMRAALLRAGHDARTAGSAEEAMQIYGSESFDILLSDVEMPGMNGHGLARWVAVHCPKSRVVLMSGRDRDCDDCPYAPRCPLIAKPFDPEAAVALVCGAPLPPPQP